MNTRLRTIARRCLPLTLAWYVVTYSGQRVAGPFLMMSDCNDIARIMSQQHYGVSSYCRSF